MTPEVETRARLRGLRDARVALWARLGLFLAVMGPGLITGVADDDATGIAGYSLAGARYGYDLLWVLLWSELALAVVNEINMRMGIATGKGFADLIRESFGVRTTLFAMVTLLVVNTATTIAEFAGIAGATELLGVSRYVSVPIAAIGVCAAVTFGTYRRFEIVLIFGSVFFFLCYVLTGLLAKPDWLAVARGTAVPTIRPTGGYLELIIVTIGTTITPWQMFYIQSSVVDKGLGTREYALERLDVYVGAAVSGLIAAFIIIASASTLWANDLPANTVSDVARAMEPLAGGSASVLFAVGLLSVSLIAAAVLPLSTVYPICEAFGWERSVNRSPRQAPAFFGLFYGQVLVGSAAVLIPGLPLLTVINLPNIIGGLLLSVMLVFALRLVNDRRVMRGLANSARQNLVALTTVGALLVLSFAYLAITFFGVSGIGG